jgi:hypothetical protein
LSSAPLSGLGILVLVLAGGCGLSASPQAAASSVRSLELRPGESATALVSTHCGYEWLEVEINGELWITTDLGSDSAGNPTEPAWPQHQPAAELDLTLVAEDHLDVTAVGTDVTHSYAPAPGPSGCE